MAGTRRDQWRSIWSRSPLTVQQPWEVWGVRVNTRAEDFLASSASSIVHSEGCIEGSVAPAGANLDHSSCTKEVTSSQAFDFEGDTGMYEILQETRRVIEFVHEGIKVSSRWRWERQ